MIKVLFILFCLSVVILIFLTIIKNKKIKKLEMENWSMSEQLDELEIKYDTLIKEVEVEKESNKKLVKKLADISCMSIDDVLHELQNNGKNSLLCS